MYGLLATAPMLADTDASSVSVLKHFVVDGGWITWGVLIPLSVLTMSMTLHYLLVVRRGTQVPVGLGRMLISAARQGQVRNILEITRDDDTMLGAAAHVGMVRLNAGREAARAAVDEVVEERTTKLFRRIEYLNVIGNVSPMIGLFGTVYGMINAFSHIYAAGGGMPNASSLARDISVALVTTFWGLLIAIPALTAYAVFRNRIDAYAAECMQVCDGMISLATGAESAEPPAGGAPIVPEPPRPAKGRSSTAKLEVRT